MEQIAGKYNIIKKLGEGATGEVYLVEHNDLKVQYALKLLSEEVSNNQAIVENFITEARLLENFTHKNTARLRDFGRNQDGRYYMTSDFCKGIALSTYISHAGATNYKLALKIIIDVLDVLSYAHKEGIIHRDIKPDNIIVDMNLEDKEYKGLKVLDFGIAKIKQDIKLNNDSLKSPSASMTFNAMGTPQYMAPEQAAGESNIDHRVDIYSTGIMLYELLSGKVPFEGDTIVQTLLMHLTRPMPPFKEELNIPQSVCDIVKNATCKLPNNRYQTANIFMKECQKVLDGENEKLNESNNADETYIIPKDENREKTKILCIDDNKMILNILTHILTKEGYDVYTTTEPENLHNYIFQENFDLIISDVNMPYLSGNEICKMLKETMPNLKIALFSNVPENELSKLAKEAGADAWISKNEKPQDWIGDVAKILET